MNLLDQLDWSYWKRLNPKEKRTLLSQLLLHFVNPLMKISDIELQDFQLYGIKCQTFQLMIDDEEFVFIPGNKDAILGWNLGTKGLSLLETAPNAQEIMIPEELRGQYNFFDVASLGEMINDKTTSLRKVQIPPMFVQRHALPAGTNYLGVYDSVTGSFSGEADQFALYEEEIKAVLSPNLTSELSVTDPYRGKNVRKMMEQANMFGLFFDTSMERFEITEDLKLTNKKYDVGIPIVDFLPLSSYYSNNTTMQHEAILSPSEYLYRKAWL